MDTFEQWLIEEIARDKKRIEIMKMFRGVEKDTHRLEGTAAANEITLAQYRAFKAQEAQVFKVGDRVSISNDEKRGVITDLRYRVHWDETSYICGAYAAEDLERIEESEETK